MLETIKKSNNTNYKAYYLKNLIEMLSKSIYIAHVYKNNSTLIIPQDSIKDVCFFLHNHTNTQFKMLIDICGVDFINRKARFEIVYHLLSIHYNERLTIKLSTVEIASLYSITSIFPNANWYEREVWDLYGVYFSGNNDLRRILTDYGFEGHPFRKDFPLSGFFELRYDENSKQVISEKIELTQKTRFFNYVNNKL